MDPIGAVGAKGGGEKVRSEPQLTPVWKRTLTPDSITLFRFSALTFNSHRIHYDAAYARETEKLPGLVVQGKWIALQLLEIVRQHAPDTAVRNFQYRSMRPLYADVPCTFAAGLDDEGSAAQLWAADDGGAIAQTASVTFTNAIQPRGKDHSCAKS